MKDACSKVFSHITEAHATLTDPKKRQDYLTLVKDGGATPDDQAKIQQVLEAATEFQKAEILMKRNPTDQQVFDLVKRAVSLDPEQVDYMALYAWLEAQLPQWQSKEDGGEDRDPGQVHPEERELRARLLLSRDALQAERRAAEGDPGLQARRRDEPAQPRRRSGGAPLHDARRLEGAPSMGGSASSPSRKPPPQPETLGGLFGKLFKK